MLARRRMRVLSILAAVAATAFSASEASAQAIGPLSPPEPSAGMSSPGAFGFGIVLSLFGVGGLGAGGYFFHAGGGACDGIDGSSVPSQAQIDACTTGTIEQVGGVVGLVAGGAFSIAGISLVIAGAIPGDPPTRPRMSFDVGPDRAGVRISF